MQNFGVYLSKTAWTLASEGILGFMRTSLYASRGLRPHKRSPSKLSRGVKIVHRAGRCARHFLAYETVCYAYRSERCTVYAVSSAQVSSSCVRAFSSSFANLHLDLYIFKVCFNVDSSLRCGWASRELHMIYRSAHLLRIHVSYTYDMVYM